MSQTFRGRVQPPDDSNQSSTETSELEIYKLTIVNRLVSASLGTSRFKVFQDIY